MKTVIGVFSVVLVFVGVLALGGELALGGTAEADEIGWGNKYKCGYTVTYKGKAKSGSAKAKTKGECRPKAKRKACKNRCSWDSSCDIDACVAGGTFTDWWIKDI